MKVLSSISLAFVVMLILGTACENTKAKSTKPSTVKARKVVEKQISVEPKYSMIFDFENYTENQLPDDWSQSFIGSGDTKWSIVDDNGNKVMAQLYSDNPGRHYNAVVNDTIVLKNMILSVRLKGVTGHHDQGGGFIWRYQDKDNYYVVRANPLENNMVLYKVKDGARTDLPLLGKGRTYGEEVPILGNDWNKMKLVVNENIFTVFLNGKELFKVQDTTFTKGGKIGFWTKADAVTYFDDFEVGIL